MNYFKILAYILIFYAGSVYSQNSGYKLITNHSPHDYGGALQNWDIVKGVNGFIYVANNDGILEYDGNSWQMIYIKNHISVRSLDIDSTGRIFVGGTKEFGFLETDGQGKFNFVSLVPENPSLRFEKIWTTHCTNNGVFFLTDNYIFRYHKTKTDIIKKTGKSFFLGFDVNNSYYVSETGTGILKFTNGKLEKIPYGAEFKEKNVLFITGFDNKNILFGSRKDGLMLYNENGFYIPKEFVEINEYLKKNQIYTGIKLCDTLFAISTLKDGIVILNNHGKIKEHFDRQKGLRGDFALSLYYNNNSQLWLALHNGIAKIELNSPISYFDERNEISGNIWAVTQHNNKTFIGTGVGIMVQNNNIFTPIKDYSGQCWYLLNYNIPKTKEELLLAATSNGIYVIKNERIIRKIADYNTYFLLNSKQDKNIVLAATSKGIAELIFNGTTWQNAGIIKNIETDCRYLAEDKEGNIWISAYQNGIYRINNLKNKNVAHFDTIHGLPNSKLVFCGTIQGKVYFASEKGLFSYNENSEKFTADTLLNKYIGTINTPFKFTEDSSENLWIYNYSVKNSFVKYLQNYKNGNYQANDTSLQRIPKGFVSFIYPASNGLVWILSSEMLVRYDQNTIRKHDTPFYCFVRKVTVNNDSIIYFGNFNSDKKQITKLLYSENEVSFTFSASFYELEKENRYSYLLDGYSREWSPWNTETKVMFNNLREGNYTFKVKCKNIYGIESTTDEFHFRIMPPYYRTWWAIVVYIILLILLIWMIIIYSAKRFDKKRAQLEQIIEERKKHETELQAAKEKAEESDKLKSSFLNNISHEIRTPLNAIVGFTDILTEPGLSQDKLKMYSEIIQASSEKLIGIITDVIEISQIQAKVISFSGSEFSIDEILTKIYDTFKFPAVKKSLTFNITKDILPEHNIIITDKDKLERIFLHLTDNSIKFTNTGSVNILCKTENNHLFFTVKDTGIGISPEMQKVIFEPFRQVETGDCRNYGGNGLGLSIVKTYAEYLGGTVSLHSEASAGTQVTVKIPVSFPATKAEPIIDKEIGKVQTILIAEDEYSNFEYLLTFFENKNIKILHAANGKEAVEYCKSDSSIGLVFMDIKMPVMDGYTAAKLIKEQNPMLPIVAQTAFSLHDKKLHFPLFFDSYITKPLNKKEIETIISKYC